jgi:hypothetical protein
MQKFHHSILVQKAWRANVLGAEILMPPSRTAETQSSLRDADETLRFAAADERSVLVVHFARELARARLGCGEFHFAD